MSITSNLYEKYVEMLGKRTNKVIGNNTKLIKDEDGMLRIVFHETAIAKITRNWLVIDSGGWKTLTTRMRLEEVLQKIGYAITQESGIWYICKNEDHSNRCIFHDGATFKSGRWVGVEKDSPKTKKKYTAMRNKVKKFCKGFVDALLNGDVPPPGPGDCFYCHMREVKSNKPLGEAVRDNGHILSHIEEEYYVPSMLLNAIRSKPVSPIAEGFVWMQWSDDGDKQAYDSFASIAKNQLTSSLYAYVCAQLGMAR